MIRKLDNLDAAEYFKLLSREPNINHYLIGYAQNYGLRRDFLSAWGEYADGALTSVLLRYFNTYYFYSRALYDAQGFSDLLREDGSLLLAGESAVVAPLEQQLSFQRKRIKQYCYLTAKSIPAQSMEEQVLDLRWDQIDEVFDLYRKVPEIGNLDNQRERAKQEFAAGHRRGTYLKQDGKMVSVALTAAETERSAMIVGVCTHPRYRGRGFSTACMTRLCRMLSGEQKTVLLFYSDPVAGRIYRTLGFSPMAEWVLLNRQTEQ